MCGGVHVRACVRACVRTCVFAFAGREGEERKDKQIERERAERIIIYIYNYKQINLSLSRHTCSWKSKKSKSEHATISSLLCRGMVIFMERRSGSPSLLTSTSRDWMGGCKQMSA